MSKIMNEAKRRQAQELAYKAMNERDLERALELCIKAIEIDPHCVDALTHAAGVFEPDERIERLTEVIRMAEEDLGGEEYFEENEGHFWEILETRPYMRARSYLADTLYEVGDIPSAINEYEALLDLNPGDNQGIRYLLMGLYLEIDDVNGVYRLVEEYDEDSAVFAWSSLLVCLIMGDTARAEEMLSVARESNRYVEDYLIGRKPMPAEIPNYYGIGDENEAIVCIDLMSTAWKKHPEAMRWLRLHAGPIQAAPRVGRNDPCSCGSGKKYKKCCLGRDQSSPTPVGNRYAAEMALNEMKEAMVGRTFSSIEEANSFLQEYNQQRNRHPVDDFEGLSPEQMHRLISFPFESPALVEFPSVLDSSPESPITELFGMLASAIGEKSLKPTAKGNLPVKVVREIARKHMGEARYAFFERGGEFRSEEEYDELHVTKITAELAGLIRKYKGRFILGVECRQLLKGDGMRAIFPILFKTYSKKFNWGYRDGHPDLDIIQSFFGYTLYLLTRYGKEWRNSTFYEDAFLRAFPAVVDSVPGDNYETKEKRLRRVYTLRTLERFAEFLGLAEIERSSEYSFDPVYRLRATPLLGDVVRFHL